MMKKGGLATITYVVYSNIIMCLYWSVVHKNQLCTLNLHN